MNNKKWIYARYTPESSEAKKLSRLCGVSPIIAALALNRGADTPEKLVSFAFKSPQLMHSPFLFEDMNKCVGIINSAIENNKKIIIYGDYDVDGITSVSLLINYLKYRGIKADYYIPDRRDEGYGVNASAMETIADGGYELMITVDTGITAAEEIAYAKSRGMEIIVTDHHQCQSILPECPVINPHVPGCAYPFKQLAGVGVAFKLVCALENRTQEQMLEMFGDIVALGTVADVMDMVDENRTIVDFGMRKMLSSPCCGIKALMKIAGIENNINASSIGFGMGPRINAAGRTGSVENAVRLMTETNFDECIILAKNLDDENKNRQKTERSILNEAVKIIENNPSFKDDKVLIVSGKGWHHGVIGIVASRICEKYSKPCILLTCEDGTAKGSGRSAGGFNLFAAISECSALLTKFGGHELAAGVTLPEENIPLMREKINEYAENNITEEMLLPIINIDFEMPEKYINTETIESLKYLEPFGYGNPLPCFSVCEAEITAVRLMGGGKHVKFVLMKNNVYFEFLAFNKPELAQIFLEGDIVDAAGVFSINEWNNTKRVQMTISDLKLSREPIPESEIPSREDMAVFYRYIRRFSDDNVFKCLESVLPRRITYDTKCIFNKNKMNNCLDVFTEMKLMSFVKNKDTLDIYILETGGRKVDLNSSVKLKMLKEGNC